MVEAFQRDDGPPYFVLSLKAGGTGLNLTAASQVIHFDPVVESGGGEPGDPDRALSHRTEKKRAGAQVFMPRDG